MACDGIDGWDTQRGVRLVGHFEFRHGALIRSSQTELGGLARPFFTFCLLIF